MLDREALIAPLLLNYDDNPEEGVAVFRRVIEVGFPGVSDHPDVLMVLGLQLMATNQLDEAEATLRQVLALSPSHVASRYNLGLLLFQQKRLQEAQVVLREVLELDPQHVSALINLANVMRDQMQREAAQALIRQAAALDPANYLPASFELFEALYAIHSTDETIFACARRASDLRSAGLQTARQMPLAKPWRKGLRPLRVGFVSGDLKTHPVGYFLQDWLPCVDALRMTLFAFSMCESQDVVAQKLRGQFAAWTDIRRLPDDEVAKLVADLQIDVLIDLSGHTDMNRLPLFARRAAPIQISWLGWYATTGVVNMDYFLTDLISSPKASAAQHSERLLYLPSTRLCLCEPIFAPPVRPLPALQKRHITFGSLQALVKITDATLALWRAVLETIPSAHLQIRCPQFAQEASLALFQRRVADCGLPLARIELLPPVLYVSYLDSYQSLDLILDTIPFTGGTTTAEALWMGVPTLTLRGNTLIARQGASLMTAAGLADWVASSQDEYIAKALHWSEHTAELAALRMSLRDKVRASPLFDSPRFARAFTQAVELAVGQQNGC